MSPRPQASRHDATALKFLNAAAHLIDAALSEDPAHLPRRLTSLHYPAALEWIRLEDVVQVTRLTQSPTASKKALVNRWPSKDEFVRDAILHALLYRDDPAADPGVIRPELARVTDATDLSSGIAEVTERLAESLLLHPRSFLLAHIAPLLPRHTVLRQNVVANARSPQDRWTSAYPEVLERLGVRFRPDWPPSRVTLAIQVMLDGLMVRSRVDPEALGAATWGRASLFTGMVIAFLAGAIDFERSGIETAAWFDRRL